MGTYLEAVVDQNLNWIHPKFIIIFIVITTTIIIIRVIKSRRMR